MQHNFGHKEIMGLWSQTGVNGQNTSALVWSLVITASADAGCCLMDCFSNAASLLRSHHLTH